MDSTLSSIAVTVRNDLLHRDGVTKFSPNRRFSTIFSEASPADTIFFVESGLVKLFKRGDESKEIIIDIVSPGQIFGEQALGADGTRSSSAEVLHEGIIYVIPRDIFVRACEEHPPLWCQLCEMLIARKRELERKIELLCLHDVEYRILFYLNELAATFGVKLNNQEFSIPLSQGELASLIGATRETTSTTLNGLARRGLIRLGRRQLIVISPDDMRLAADNRVTTAASN